MKTTQLRRKDLNKTKIGLGNGSSKISRRIIVDESFSDNSTQEKEGDHDEYSRYISEGSSSPPGSWFNFYRRFGYYWNYFPKTDYTYLPSSRYYNQEISPGVLVMPNLSRRPIRPRSSISFEGNDSYLAGSEDEEYTSPTRRRVRQVVTRGLRLLGDSSVRWSYSVVRVVTRTVTTVSQVVTTSVSTVTQVVGGTMAPWPAETRRSRSLPCLLLLPFILLLFLFYLASGRESEEVVAVSDGKGWDAWQNVSEAGVWCLDVVRWASYSSYLFVVSCFASLSSLLGSLFYPRHPPLANLPSKCVSANQDFSVILLALDSMKQKIESVEQNCCEKEKDSVEDVRLKINTLEHNLAELKKNLHEVKDIAGSRQQVDLTSLKGAIDADLMSGFVSSAIAKYHADQTAQPDFALQSSGGEVVSIRCTSPYSRPPQYYLWGVGLPWMGRAQSPDVVLRPGTMPGDCWAFEGEYGYLVVKLSSRVKVTGFTIDHAPQEILPRGHMTSAPKDFQVFGLRELNDPEAIDLGTFRFLNNGKSVQTFQAKESEETFELVELQISSNHGHMGYTCLYRFRVHGVPQEMDSVYIGGPL